MNTENFNFHIPSWEEIPDVGLYLTQTVTLLQNYLSPFVCNKEEKVITNTMINNYVKQNIIDSPINKKYRREDIALLFVICILKQVYSINDVKKLFKLSFKTNKTIKTSYKSFCLALDKSICAIFNHEDQPDLHSKSKSKYILRNVANSFASKLYVQKLYLKS